MSEKQNTLAKGMFVREHTFNSGTKILNVSINVAEFCSFIEGNMIVDSKDRKWVNLKLIPNKNVGDNKLSHTPILNEYTPSADEALKSLAAQVLTPSAEERAIVETPTKKTKGKAVKKAIKKAVDNLPF